MAMVGVNGCVIFDWPDPVGPGLAVLFRRPGVAIQKNAANDSSLLADS